jgi:hypothetical protein
MKKFTANIVFDQKRFKKSTEVKPPSFFWRLIGRMFGRKFKTHAILGGVDIGSDKMVFVKDVQYSEYPKKGECIFFKRFFSETGRYGKKIPMVCFTDYGGPGSGRRNLTEGELLIFEFEPIYNGSVLYLLESLEFLTKSKDWTVAKISNESAEGALEQMRHPRSKDPCCGG